MLKYMYCTVHLPDASLALILSKKTSLTIRWLKKKKEKRGRGRKRKHAVNCGHYIMPATHKVIEFTSLKPMYSPFMVNCVLPVKSNGHPHDNLRSVLSV